MGGQEQNQTVDPAIQQITEFVTSSINNGDDPVEIVMGLVNEQVDQQIIAQAFMSVGYQQEDLIALFEQVQKQSQPAPPASPQEQNKNPQEIARNEKLGVEEQEAEAQQEQAMVSQQDAMSQNLTAKSGIEIKPENKGKFTRWAKARGMSVLEASRKVMSNPDAYSTSVVKMANFAKNAAGWKKEGGEEFIPHVMHKAGKSRKADTYDQHLKLKEMGYIHKAADGSELSEAQNFFNTTGVVKRDDTLTMAPKYVNPAALNTNSNFSLGDAAAVLKEGYNTFLGDDGLISNRKENKAKRKAEKGEYYNYDVTVDPNDPNTYAGDSLDLFNASKNRGGLRDLQTFTDDVNENSRANYNVETGEYDALLSSRPLSEDIYGEKKGFLGIGKREANSTYEFGEDLNYFGDSPYVDDDTRDLIMGTQDDPEGTTLGINEQGQASSYAPGADNPYEYNTMMGYNTVAEQPEYVQDKLDELSNMSMIPTGSNGQPEPAMYRDYQDNPIDRIMDFNQNPYNPDTDADGIPNTVDRMGSAPMEGGPTSAQSGPRTQETGTTERPSFGEWYIQNSSNFQGKSRSDLQQIYNSIGDNEFRYGGALPKAQVGKFNLNAPTAQDSLDLYNNTRLLEQYYKNYQPGISGVNGTDGDGPFPGDPRVFENLQEVTDFYEPGWDRITNRSDNDNVSLDEYYQYIDENKFKQREIGNEMLDLRTPMGLYDKRIPPTMQHYYTNNIPGDYMEGDLVDIPLYDPALVIPESLIGELSPEELIRRREFQKNNPSKRYGGSPPKAQFGKGLKKLQQKIKDNRVANTPIRDASASASNANTYTPSDNMSMEEIERIMETQGGFPLGDAEVSTLSDKSYNKLDPKYQQVYDAYQGNQTIPFTTKVSPPNAGRTLGYSVFRKDDIHWQDALRMVQDSGVDEIYNHPLEKARDREKYDTVDWKLGKDFRAHAWDNNIHIPELSAITYGLITDGGKNSGYLSNYHLDQAKEYMRQLKAELAHVDPRGTDADPFSTPKTNLSRIGRWITERGYPDETNYQSDWDKEYNTHYAPDGTENMMFDEYNFSNRLRRGSPQITVNKYGGGLPKAQGGNQGGGGDWDAMFPDPYDVGNNNQNTEAPINPATGEPWEQSQQSIEQYPDLVGIQDIELPEDIVYDPTPKGNGINNASGMFNVSGNNLDDLNNFTFDPKPIDMEPLEMRGIGDLNQRPEKSLMLPPEPPSFDPPEVKRKNKLSGAVNRIKDRLEPFGKAAEWGVKAAGVANDWFADRRVDKATADNRKNLLADNAYGTNEDPFMKRGAWDINTGTFGSEGQRTVQTNMGIAKQGGEMANVDSIILAKLIAAGADIEIL